MAKIRFAAIAIATVVTAVCCNFVWASVPDLPASESIAFVTPDALHLTPAPVKVPQDDIGLLVDAWFSELSSKDPSLAVGAMNLLKDAPSAFIDTVSQRLDRDNLLGTVIAKSSPEMKTAILGSPAMESARLWDFAESEFSAQLKTAMNSGDHGDSASLIHLASLAYGFRHLPRNVVVSVLSKMGTFPDQAQSEWIAVLFNHVEDLRPSEPVLKEWLTQSSTTSGDNQLKLFARAALLELRVAVPQNEVSAALKSDDQMSIKAAIRYVSAIPQGAELSALENDAFSLLTRSKDLTTWLEAFQLVQARYPKDLAALYAHSAAISQQLWPPEIWAEWVLRAPDAVSETVAALPLDIHALAESDAENCGMLRYQLAVLTRRAQTGKPTLDEFWDAIAIRGRACRTPISDEVDRYLNQASKVEDVGQRLASLLDKPGIGQLATVGLRSTRLSQALAPEMSRRIMANEWPLVKQLLSSGIRPDPTVLQQRNFWSQANWSSTSGLTPELYFRIFQAAAPKSDDAIKRARLTAADKSEDPAIRVDALIALSAAEDPEEVQGDLNSAMADPNQLVSRTAIVLLGRAFDSGVPKQAFHQVSEDALRQLLAQPDVSGEAKELLARLLPFGSAYAQLYIQQADWQADGSSSCFRLVPAIPIDNSTGISMLNQAAKMPSISPIVLACIGIVAARTEPVAIVAGEWNSIRHATDPAELLQAVQSLWKDKARANADPRLLEKFEDIVSSNVSSLPYSPSSQLTLKWWEQQLAVSKPTLADEIRSERLKRTAIAAAIAIPGAVFIHLVVWALLLTIYPKSTSVQAVVFWNPLVRKVLGFGYIDLVLLYVPFARRRLFAPFSSEFLRDINSPQDESMDRRAYFEGSHVYHRPARNDTNAPQKHTTLPIIETLRNHRGRVLLLGKSGLGKSSYLRFWLSRRGGEGKDVLIFLRADQCRDGVETEILRRMQNTGSDQSLVRSMIYSGRFAVYVDGYNEVDMATQDAITSFLGNYPHGNVMVASQIPLRGFTRIETFELVPLDREQIQDFLTSRDTVLPEDSVISGSAFTQASTAFLEDTWTRAKSEEEVKAFADVLANPMDLTSVALLLAQGRVPDIFALEEQQFDTVKRDLQAAGLDFRTRGFSEALLQQRLHDQEDLGELPFKPEVAQLVHAKLAQVRTFVDPSGKVAAQEVRFRHDRIRDFFTHFAFLEMSDSDLEAHAQDVRFAGVFPYLARSLPSSEAEDLRERLITLAANIEDHRVSDSFVRELSWRQRFSPQDPGWMIGHDLPAARAAESSYEKFAEENSFIQQRLNTLRDEISNSRRITRVLTTYDPATALQLATEMFVAMGAKGVVDPTPIGVTLISPEHQRFLVVALTQREAIRQFHVDLLVARVANFQLPKVVLVNANVSEDPELRTSALTSQMKSELITVVGVVLECVELYNYYARHCAGDISNSFWGGLEAYWANSASNAKLTAGGKA